MLALRSRLITLQGLTKITASLNNNPHRGSYGVDTTASSAPSKYPLKWELISAVCLERLPVISPPMKPIELEFSKMVERIDIQKSLKSDHELRFEEEKKQKKVQSDEVVDIEAVSRQTVQDYEDACNEEFSKFVPASRTTSADATGDRKSMERKLDRHLLLVVQEKAAAQGKQSWTLPSAAWTPGESLRQTAERAISGHVAASTPIRILGNAPWGVHTIKYPSSIRGKKGVDGIKVFFFKAQCVSPNQPPQPVNNSNSADYNWLGREELKDFLEPDYLHSVEQFLIDED